MKLFGEIIFLIIIGLVIYAIINNAKKENAKQEQDTSSNVKNDNITAPIKEEEYNYTNSYRPKWLLTSNEKNAYRKIKEVTDKLGLTLFAKVRLYDLVEPKPGCKNFKGAQWKIQAKHVDFVVCTPNLVAKTVIELDDSSHNNKDRKERDDFVDAVLKATGYKLIRTRFIDQAQLEADLSSLVTAEN